MSNRFSRRLFYILLSCVTLGLFWATATAESRNKNFQLEPESELSTKASELDVILNLAGLPAIADGPAEATYLTYDKRYQRDLDDSFGKQSSSKWYLGNIDDRLLEQALGSGSGYFSSWSEGWLGGYGKARINFRVNRDGDITGSGDFLYPFYDSTSTTSFTQLGLRTMTNDRVIGNFGLGQRFFPVETLALGYNVFIDQDFSRGHTRGGTGVEFWYDSLRLAANYYTPFSGWKDSRDYDSRLVEERPAEGYDARLTGYLPSYPNLAVTGAFEKWKGEHVGSFGSNDLVQKNPKIWSYGLGWTPVPILTASIDQRHSGSHKETQFGLTLNYHFGIDWQKQLRPAAVAEMRSVGGSRHDFVNRQNEIILEYRAKESVYNIVLLRTRDATRNLFEFQITDGFGKGVSGQTVNVSAESGVEVLNPSTEQAANQFNTDDNGRITIQLSPLAAGTATVTLTAGRTSRAFSINVITLENLNLAVASRQNLVNSTLALTFTMAGPAAVDNQTVSWSTSAGALSSTTSATDSGGLATVDLTGPATPGAVTVRATLDNGHYVETEVLFGTLRGTLTVQPQSGSGDIVASSGSTVLQATIAAPQFNDGSSEVAYTGSLAGLVVTWSKKGEYVYSQTGASASPPSGISLTSLLNSSLFSDATQTDASGVAKVTFAPGISSGTAGGVQIQAALATPHSVDGTINVAVGFNPNWLYNSSPDGWFTAYQYAGGTGNTGAAGYQPGTNLPTFEQLLGISNNHYRPKSLAKESEFQFWTGVASGFGPSSGSVDLTSSKAVWSANTLTDHRVLILQ